MDLQDYSVSEHYFWTVELRSKGPARFFGAGFLGLWLCGWLAGEVFALTAILSMLFGAVLPVFFTERLPDTSDGGGPFAVIFLLVWLTFWTLGGIFAIRQLITLLWGREEISAGPDVIRVRRGAGPFVGEKKLDRRKIKSIRMKKALGPIRAETSDGLVTVAALGTREERNALRDRLREFLQVQAPDAWVGGEDIRLPERWERAADVTGATVLRRSRAPQAKAARVAWGITVLAGLVCSFVVIRLSPGSGDGGPTGLIFITGGIMLLAAIGSVFFTWGRHEFVAQHRKLEVRRGLDWFLKSKIFMEPVLTIKTREDSDGDVFISLVVKEGEKERTLLSAMNEAREPVMIGRWLAREMGAELVISPEVKEYLAA